MIVNEASLITVLEIDEMIQCYEVYEHGGCLSIILELMDNGSMAEIVHKNHDKYSEQFCKYTLYSVALGLAKMHNNNVLHRDIKSDNILTSS